MVAIGEHEFTVSHAHQYAGFVALHAVHVFEPSVVVTDVTDYHFFTDSLLRIACHWQAKATPSTRVKGILNSAFIFLFLLERNAVTRPRISAALENDAELVPAVCVVCSWVHTHAVK